MKSSEQSLLLKLAEFGCLSASQKLTTGQLAKELKVSQQTMSRWLVDFEEQGLLNRSGGLRLTTDARKHLLQWHSVLSKSFKESEKTITFQGVVASGLNESAFYMSLPGYVEQFKALLGYEPVPGTINVRITSSQLADSEKLANSKGIRVKEWSDKKRTYGGANLFKCTINKIPGYLIYPDRNHYGPEVLQILSKRNLTRAGLKIGAKTIIVTQL